ncbi:VOC family protein [Actinokineospora diospyrosa]|uniref:Glyoxalase superfamily enzyme, possibly 3-demethylubiquinone-9 3-methyltransferase n=1 Tax=Actinokineospora diospyrosa TaxID=103728 RepID=A0ABT1IHN2_9PSEU|nr:VOC family protein [Actinokineospora diospyrosa]MCP2272129.1 Glyoxalase superfamily enzyme, possibly 3-demethylubiquinone-9 3-methyltransferase [Actinokineospora diospyrosa]
MSTVQPKVTPFLMFQGKQAEAAITFYVSLFDDGEVLDLKHAGPDGPGGPDAEGTVHLASFRAGGQVIRAIDSAPVHDFTFTPSISLYVTCESEAEIDRLYAALSEGGQPLMPLGDYGFSVKFGWVNDRFGVSWQLNLV